MNEIRKKDKNTQVNITKDIASKKQWAEKLLTRVQIIRHSRGANRSKELSKLESEILLNIDPKYYESIIDKKILEGYESLIRKLKKRFHGLTENELILCGYIRMNLESAEIATLKGITTRSVNMARYRLKKRLGLIPKEDLDLYIQNL